MVARIPLIEELTVEPIPPRSQLLVEYDAGSQWYNATLTITAAWLKQGGTLSYNLTLHSPDSLRSRLQKSGLNPAKLEADDKLRIQDYHTATLGRASGERLHTHTIKVNDMTLEWAKIIRAYEQAGPETHLLRIWDNLSTLGRFNDDKAWVEVVLSRDLLLGEKLGATTIRGIVKGVHEEWVYRRLEDSHDGIIDIKLEDVGKETVDMIRIRGMREVNFDRNWHRLKIDRALVVTLAE